MTETLQTPEVVISDTSCLIVLSKIGQLELLEKRYGRILITQEVREEYGNPLPEWIIVSKPSLESLQKVAAYNIDPGETAAIALALDLPGCTLIADDEEARYVAEQFHITITGTVGFLIKAKNAGLIPAIKPLIEQILTTDFRISSRIVQKALSDAGEL